MNDNVTTKAAPTPAQDAPKKKLHPALKFVLELGPVIIFFVVNSKYDIFAATIVLMVSVVATLGISWAITRHLPAMPLVTAALVLVFGTLTVILHDENFIKLKVTILYTLLGGALIGALYFGKLLLPIVFDMAIHMDDAGWRKLTWRWGLFFFLLAGLNEIFRRVLTTDQWMYFKTFGILPLTVVFAIAQTPLILRHEIPAESDDTDAHF
jgi:intracellular septation protein